MVERPIIFSTAMIRALLEGRKSQMRQIVKPQPIPFSRCSPDRHPTTRTEPYIDAYCGEKKLDANPRGMSRYWHWWTADNRPGARIARCPFGVPGDRLWLRETWSAKEWAGRDVRVRYAADGKLVKADAFKIPAGYRLPVACRKGDGWARSIHMPRWASRITLEITDIRMERLDSVSEGDAFAEGVSIGGFSGGDNRDARRAFFTLWESMYGSGSLKVNPMVWALDFKLIPADLVESGVDLRRLSESELLAASN